MSVLRAVRSPILFYRALNVCPRFGGCRWLSDNQDAPIKYSASPAAQWKASLSRQGANKEDVSAWFQPYVAVASMAALLIYFCVLREENDLDELLSVSLYDRIEGLEKLQLEASLNYNKENNLPTQAIEKRIQELEKEEIKRFGHKRQATPINQ